MPSNFLQIVQTACDELGLSRPSVVVNSTDLQIRQLGALVKRDLRELQQNYDWTALQTEYDLHVSPPFNITGDLTAGSYDITNVSVAPASDFNSDFNSDFGSSIDLFSNPTLWVVTGPGIPVATRLASITLPDLTTMDQPATVTTTGAAIVIAQDTYPGPADFDRYINQTWWDRTNRWALLGPDSPQVDQWHRSGVVTIGPRRSFRQIGYNGLTAAQGAINNYRLWPPPGANNTPINIAFEYITINTVLSATGTPKPTFTVDTDFPILDENMMILGVKWRMWQIKGFDYAPMQAEYQDYVDRRYGNDGGAKTLSLSGRRPNYLLTSGNVQDGNYPGPGNP